jgi:hypothetical protein
MAIGLAGGIEGRGLDMMTKDTRSYKKDKCIKK